MNFQQLRSVRETVRLGFNLTEVAAGAAHLAARREPADPRAGRRARHRDLRARRQAPDRPDAAGRSGAAHRRAAAARRRQPASASATTSRAADAGRAVDRGHALAGALRAAHAWCATSAQLYPQVHAAPAPGLAASRWPQMLLVGRGRHRHRHRGAGRTTTQLRRPALLPLDAQRRRAARPRAAATPTGRSRCSAWRAFPLITYDAGYTGRTHIDEAFAQRRA